jgi:hypothetical protein
MQLTADLFREIIQPLAPGAEGGDQLEQRRGPRARADVWATILPFSDSFSLRAIEVPVRDVSRGGFGFLYDQPVPLGESFGLVLPEGDGPPVVVLCSIAFWQPLSKDLYSVGARFTEVLSRPGAEPSLRLQDIPPDLRKAS